MSTGIGQALPLIMQVAGTAISAKGALDSSSATASAANFNASIEEQNALIAQEQGAAGVVSQRRLAAMRIGDITSGYGASGVRADTGSPLDILESSASAAKLDEQMVKYNADLKARGFLVNASLNRRRAASAETSGLYSAAGAILTGGAKAYGMFPPSSGAGTPIPWYGTTERTF